MGGGSRLSSNCVSTSRELDRLRFWPLSPSGLSSLEVNMVVTEILDAARESAKTGRRIDLPAN